MTGTKKILLLLPTGMTIRNFLSTDIVKEILKNPDYEILCCLKDPKRYKSYIEHDRVKFIEFIERSNFSLTTVLHSILRQRFYSIKSNRTLDILEKGPLFASLKVTISSLLKYPFPRSRLIYGFFKFLEKKVFFQRKSILNQFIKYSPDLVFSTHLVSKEEYDYLRTANNLKIPTIGMVKSFDNLTSKGYLAFETDHVLLWNEMMKKELIEMYEYDPRNIKITGIPQFDIYKERPSLSRDEFSNKYNLSPQKKTILYATNHRDISPDDPDNITLLASSLDKLDAQLIVRLHQMDQINRYKSLEFDNVIYQVPGIEEGKNTQEKVAYKDFMKELRDVLYFSDVTINTCSTMTLDALASGRPVINICFDQVNRPYYKSVKRLYDFLHYKPIIEHKATLLAKSPEELISFIGSNLRGEELRKDEREKVSDYMMAGNLGNASKRVAQSVVDIFESYRK